jgi:hypothetical protein
MPFFYLSAFHLLKFGGDRPFLLLDDLGESNYFIKQVLRVLPLNFTNTSEIFRLLSRTI